VNTKYKEELRKSERDGFSIRKIEVERSETGEFEIGEGVTRILYRGN